MQVAINRVHYPVMSLGFGRRVGIWFQGCSIHCRGCIVPETWAPSTYFVVEYGDLTAAIDDWVGASDGLTISGGEPFDQPDALLRLVRWARQRCEGDILVYSGYGSGRLHASHADILAEIDVLISEPFVASRSSDHPFIGSSNQRLELLTPLGKERYSNSENHEREIGVSIVDGAMLFAGVPKRGDLSAVTRVMAASGDVSLELTHEAI